MRKKRYFPFGYRMTGGQIEIDPEEGALLQSLFDGYIKGASIIKLADMAEKTGIKFRENADHWNKNMIARILDDSRYWNGNHFPAIVTMTTGIAAMAMRKQKAISRRSIPFIQKKLVCSNCGKGINRNSKSFPRIHWECKQCEWHFGPLSDSELLQAVTEKLITICHNPQTVEPDHSPPNRLSLQAVRLTNEINQLLNQRKVDANHALSLILECAAEKYKTCGIKESDHLTTKIETLLQEHSSDEKLDQKLFDQTVKQVILQANGSVQLRLLNGKIV